MSTCILFDIQLWSRMLHGLIRCGGCYELRSAKYGSIQNLREIRSRRGAICGIISCESHWVSSLSADEHLSSHQIYTCVLNSFPFAFKKDIFFCSGERADEWSCMFWCVQEDVTSLFRAMGPEFLEIVNAADELRAKVNGKKVSNLCKRRSQTNI